MKIIIILAVISVLILCGLFDSFASTTAMLFIKSIASCMVVFCFSVWWKIYK